MLPKLLVAAAALGVVGLTGCSGAQPGLAARVGDRSISTTEVSSLTVNYCKAIARQLGGENQQVPMGQLATGILQSQVMKAAAEQLAAEWDVEPGKAYVQKRANLEQGVKDLDAEVGDAVVEVQSAFDYVNDILNQAAGKALEEDGVEVTQEDQTARARDLFATWIAANEPEINPKYGVEIADVEPVVADTSTSFAVSELAKAAAADEPDAAYVAGLPESQRCG